MQPRRPRSPPPPPPGLNISLFFENLIDSSPLPSRYSYREASMQEKEFSAGVEQSR